jgi:uncharacterized membrane protein YebE (DUF533 family)
MDETERAKILSRASESGLTSEEQSWLQNEMANPRSIEEITCGVSSPTMKRMIFGFSYGAIEEDTDEERSYLQKLAQALGLSEQEANSIRESF